MLLAITVINGLKFCPRMHFQNSRRVVFLIGKQEKNSLFYPRERRLRGCGRFVLRVYGQRTEHRCFVKTIGYQILNQITVTGPRPRVKKDSLLVQSARIVTEDTTYINYGQNGESLHCVECEFSEKKKARLILLFKSGPRSDFGTLIRQYFALLFSNLPDITAKDRFEIQAFTLLYFDPKNIKLGLEIRAAMQRKDIVRALKKRSFPNE